MRCIPRYFCSTKSSKRPSTALINHTINQNSIQLSAQTPSKISVSLIIKFRRGLSLFARGRAAAWHCHFRHSGKAVSALSSRSSVSQRCRKQRDGDGCSQQHFSLFSSFCFFHTFFTSSYLFQAVSLRLYYLYFSFCSSLSLPRFPSPPSLAFSLTIPFLLFPSSSPPDPPIKARKP